MSFIENRKQEIEVYMRRDPAARNWLEIVFCYPGLHAVWLHRANHVLWNIGLCWLARFLSHLGRIFTGVEIHPAAKLGVRIFIDHGMGVVIGASSEVGDDCSIYQGVTLGGTTQIFRGKRHPTLEPGVIVGAGAKVLGPIVIGEGARIGSNAVVVKEVPPGCTAVGVPAHVIGKSADSSEDSEQQFAAYAVDEKSASCEDMVETLSAKVAELEAKINKILSQKSTRVKEKSESPQDGAD